MVVGRGTVQRSISRLRAFYPEDRDLVKFVPRELRINLLVNLIEVDYPFSGAMKDSETDHFSSGIKTWLELTSLVESESLYFLSVCSTPFMIFGR